MPCNCNEVLSIGVCGPYANHADTQRAIDVLGQCRVGDISPGIDPVSTPAAALAEAFPDGFIANCIPEEIYLRRSDGAVFVSVDGGDSFNDVGGSAGAASSVQGIEVLNNSAIQLELGHVVIWDFTEDKAVTTTTTKNDVGVAGVWTETTLAGNAGVMTMNGIASVQVDGPVVRGDILVTSTLVGKATRYDGTHPIQGRIGRALESIASAGTILARVEADYGFAKAAYIDPDGSFSATATIATANTWADVDGTNLNLSVKTSGHPVRIRLRGALYETSGTTAQYGYLSFLVDGVTRLYNSGNGVYQWESDQEQAVIDLTVYGLSAGTHTFKVQWSHTQSGGSVQLKSRLTASGLSWGNIVEFRVEEVL